MKKSPLTKSTARLYPDEEFEATIVTPITSDGYVSNPLSYCPFRGIENLSCRALKICFDPYRSRIETLEKASEAP